MTGRLGRRTRCTRWVGAVSLAGALGLLSAQMAFAQRASGLPPAQNAEETATAQNAGRVPAQLASGQPLAPQLLDGRSLACQAAQQWLPAQALRARGRTILTAYQAEDAELQLAARRVAAFFNLQACQQEDTAAANALRAYYTRLAVAEQLQLTLEAEQWLTDEQARVAQAQQSGLATGSDPTEFDRRRLEIADQRLQLHSQERQLRESLTRLTGCDYAMHEVHQEVLEIQISVLDCPGLVAQAIGARYDLRSWQCLLAAANESSAPVVAQVLATAVGGFGLPLPPIVGLKSWLCPPDHADLARQLQTELRCAAAAAQQAIEQNVAEKCAQLELAYGRWELSQQTVASWASRRQQLRDLEALGRTQPEQWAAAQASWLQSRGTEISRRLDARLAEVALAEAGGQLAQRCCRGQAWFQSAPAGLAH